MIHFEEWLFLLCISCCNWNITTEYEVASEKGDEKRNNQINNDDMFYLLQVYKL